MSGDQLPASGEPWTADRFASRVDILSLIVRNVALHDVLQVIALLVERELPGSYASILLLDEDRRLRVGAGPSLPKQFLDAVDGEQIGPGRGSCGTAAAEKRVVIHADIDSEPAWEAWRPAAQGAGLAACWSTPFLGEDDSVLGTFAVYFAQPRRPDDAELAVLRDAGHYAALAVAHHRTRRELDERQQVDPLTGLPGRDELYRRLSELEQAAGSTGEPFAVVLVSLEGLSSLNEWFGPSVGDQMLRLVADGLREVVDGFGFAAHVWGSDFVVVSPAVGTEEQAVAFADRLHAAVTTPLDVDGMTLEVAATLGVTLRHDGGSESRSNDETIRNINVALQRAKAEGEHLATYDPDFDPGAEATRLAPALRHGIEQEELSVAYQPIVALADGQLAHYEALLRWSGRHGAVGPGSFVPMAERTGLVRDLDRFALRRALAELHRQREDGNDIGMSVNLSARQLSGDGIGPLIAELIQQYALPPDTLTLEITEGVLVAANTGWRALAEIRDQGVRIALDDFGTGFSQISYLRRFRFDEIKIDQSLVRELDSDRGATAIVTGIIAFALTAGMSVVAEGVEREEQADALRRLGCTHGQGHLFGAAAPLTAAAG